MSKLSNRCSNSRSIRRSNVHSNFFSHTYGSSMILAFTVMLVLGLGFSVLAETPKKGGTLVFGLVGDAEGINPVTSSTGTAHTYSSMVYESVIKINRDTMEPANGPLCTRYASSKDSLTWTFYLKKGVKFSDGHELTAEDVKYTFDAIKDPKTNTTRRSYTESIQNIKIIDDYTIQFSLKYPDPNFLTGTMTFGILPAHLFLGKDINTNPVSQKPVGTGPFVLTEWKRDDHATFVAREDYHRGRINIDKVIFKIVANNNALLLAAEAGDLDMAIVPPAEVERISDEAAKKHLKLYSRWDFGYSYIGFNMRREPFNDLRVRKALTMAIYKPAIIKVAYFGQGQPATSNIVPGISWAYNPNIPEYEYNLEGAKKLLTAAGWVDKDGDGIRERNGKKLAFTILTNKGSASREKTMAMAQYFWKKVGAAVSIDAITYSTFMSEKVNKRNFDVIVLSWSGLGPDPDDYSIWHSSQTDKGLNYVGYKNSVVDDLLTKARTTMDIPERKAMYYQIQKLIHDDYPYIFLQYIKSNAVFNDKVRGVDPNPLDSLYISDWKNVYLVE